MQQTTVPSAAMPLANVLTYENENVIYRFTDHFNIEREEALEIFSETKKWLWLCSVSIIMKENTGKAPKTFISTNLLIIDEMWHTFLMFTKDYKEFCMKYLGVFIHHSPASKAEKEASLQRSKDDPEGLKKEMEEQTRELFSFIYDYLGEEVLLKWHEQLPERFSKETINNLRKTPD